MVLFGLSDAAVAADILMWYCLVCLVVLFGLSDAVAADILMWYCLVCLVVLFGLGLVQFQKSDSLLI